MGYSDTVAGHAAIGAIKKRGGFNVMCIQRPVPVTGKKVSSITKEVSGSEVVIGKNVRLRTIVAALMP